MKITGMLLVVLLLYSTQILASDSISNWISSQENVVFDIAPSNFDGLRDEDVKVLWIGAVEDISVYANEHDETVIEYYCRYLPLAKTNQREIKVPIEVTSQNYDYFIFSIKAPAMSNAQMKNIGDEIVESSEVAVVLGSPYEKTNNAERTIAYITSEQVITSEQNVISILGQ